MAYKISGSVSEDSQILVLNDTTLAIESSTSVTAGAYEVGDLSNSPKTVLARGVSGSAYGYTNVSPVYSGPQPLYGASITGIKRDYYTLGLGVTKPTSTTLYLTCGNTYVQYGSVYCSFDKEVINGNKVQIDWGASTNGGVTAESKVIDGEYNRTLSTDFPAEQKYLIKGAGVLYTLCAPNNAFGRTTFTSGVLDLSASQLPQVTFVATIGTSYGRTCNCTIYAMRVLSPTNEVLTQLDMSASLVWPEYTSGQNWWYGKLGTPITITT